MNDNILIWATILLLFCARWCRINRYFPTGTILSTRRSSSIASSLSLVPTSAPSTPSSRIVYNLCLENPAVLFEICGSQITPKIHRTFLLRFNILVGTFIPILFNACGTGWITINQPFPTNTSTSTRCFIFSTASLLSLTSESKFSIPTIWMVKNSYYEYYSAITFRITQSRQK